MYLITKYYRFSDVILDLLKKLFISENKKAKNK